jgi:ATP-dependent RNA helicase DDX5/DBP2
MAIHGSKTQGERDFVMDEFRKGRISIMIATDVAARGIGKVPPIFYFYLFIYLLFLFFIYLLCQLL